MKTTCFTCGNKIAKGQAYELHYAQGFERSFCAKCNEERESQWDDDNIREDARESA